MSDADWRLRGQERYLDRATLRWSTWSSYRDGWDHDHCEFCSAEISDRPTDDDTSYHSAWVTADNYRWICPACFADFRDRFGWAIEESTS